MVQLKCDETKPSCRNCQKKGQECPGYTLRLQWSTKYERPRDPARPEPTNFGALVSAVTQSIVANDNGRSPSFDAPRAKFARMSSCESTAAFDMMTPKSFPSPTPGSIKPSRSPATVSRTVTSAPAMLSQFMHPAQLDPMSQDLLAAAAHPDYSGSVDLTSTSGFVDFDASVMFSSGSTSGGSVWGNSQNSSPAPGSLESLVSLATSGDVDEPEASLNGSEADVFARPTQCLARPGRTVSRPPRMTRSLVDIPSFLINHWFNSVCSSWSAFDSQVNPYRQLSLSLCHSSMAVFYALQSMAAASLVEHLPHLKEVTRSAPRLAAQAITYELQSFHASRKGPISFPGGLVLSLFCMSSSICWTDSPDSRQFGLQFLKPGRDVLKCMNKVAGYLNSSDQQLLNFFNGCLIYEEMLRSIVSNDETDMENLAGWQASSAQAISTVPHAWTGVSPDLLRIFGKTMYLCRRSRSRWRQPESVANKLLKETLDYQEAVAIEEVLLSTELPEQRQMEDGTEEAAVRRHLHDAAEAYRLSSLLQLYQTFPGLIARRLPGQADANGFVPYSGWLSPLALHITSILRTIPPSSSMRCLQPLLCLCAGTGLRYDNVDPMMQGQDNPLMASSAQVPPGPGLASMGSAPSPSPYRLQGLSTTVIGENDLQIASARRFIMERLSRLEQNLPSKPIQVEKQLLKSIWSTYDSETETTITTHWLDVMVNNHLESVFG